MSEVSWQTIDFVCATFILLSSHIGLGLVSCAFSLKMPQTQKQMNVHHLRIACRDAGLDPRWYEGRYKRVYLNKKQLEDMLARMETFRTASAQHSCESRSRP